MYSRKCGFSPSRVRFGAGTAQAVRHEEREQENRLPTGTNKVVSNTGSSSAQCTDVISDLCHFSRVPISWISLSGVFPRAEGFSIETACPLRERLLIAFAIVVDTREARRCPPVPYHRPWNLLDWLLSANSSTTMVSLSVDMTTKRDVRQNQWCAVPISLKMAIN